MVSTERTFHVIQGSVTLLNMQIWSIFGCLCQFWQPEHDHVLQKKKKERKDLYTWNLNVFASGLQWTNQHLHLSICIFLVSVFESNKFVTQPFLSQIRVPMGNHAGISVLLLTWCFNVTLPLFICKRMISQSFITCYLPLRLGCGTTFIQTPVWACL